MLYVLNLNFCLSSSRFLRFEKSNKVHEIEYTGAIQHVNQYFHFKHILSVSEYPIQKQTRFSIAMMQLLKRVHCRFFLAAFIIIWDNFITEIVNINISQFMKKSNKNSKIE